LHHLRDLLFERHARQQRGDLRFELLILRHRARNLWPRARLMGSWMSGRRTP
jgi:hypothetical protein